MSSINDGDAPDHEQTACDMPDPAGLAPSSAEPKPPTPKNCRNFIRRKTANAMPEIVKTFVQKAKQGSVPHFTSLAKMGGFDQRPVQPAAKKPERKSLARQLLDEVERYEAQHAAAKAAAEDAAAAASTGDRNGNPGPQEHS